MSLTFLGWCLALFIGFLLTGALFLGITVITFAIRSFAYV